VELGLEPVERLLGSASRDEALATLAFLAAEHVRLPAEQLHAARRRALLLRAAGGDPRRPLSLDERAVRALAADLDEPGLRAELHTALTGLRARAAAFPAVAGTLDVLLERPELAWRAFACALLADELSA
jgi:hypothetical protein